MNLFLSNGLGRNKKQSQQAMDFGLSFADQLETGLRPIPRTRRRPGAKPRTFNGKFQFPARHGPRRWLGETRYG